MLDMNCRDNNRTVIHKVCTHNKGLNSYIEEFITLNLTNLFYFFLISILLIKPIFEQFLIFFLIEQASLTRSKNIYLKIRWNLMFILFLIGCCFANCWFGLFKIGSIRMVFQKHLLSMIGLIDSIDLFRKWLLIFIYILAHIDRVTLSFDFIFVIFIIFFIFIFIRTIF